MILAQSLRRRVYGLFTDFLRFLLEIDSGALRKAVYELQSHVPNKISIRVFNQVGMESVNPEFLGQPKLGHVGVITQSGILRRTIFNMLIEENLGLSECIAFDGKTGIDWSALEKLSKDTNTKVLVILAEAISKGRAMMEIARIVTRTKPIIVLKSGNTEPGSRGVLCHTGLLAGSSEICKAAFKQCRMLQAYTLEQVIDFVKALSCYETAKTSRIGIVSNGGGLGIMCADACMEMDLEVQQLSDRDKSFLGKELFVNFISNPLDLSAAATVQDYRSAITYLLGNAQFDILMVIVTPTPLLNLKKLAIFLLETKQTYDVPIVLCVSGSSTLCSFLREMTRNTIPLYDQPERAVAGAYSLVYYGRRRNRKY